MLDLPENLMSAESQPETKETSELSSWRGNKILAPEQSATVSSASSVSQTRTHLISDAASIQTGSAKVVQTFVEVVRILSKKLICLCLDDLQFADEESIDLLCNIMTRKLNVALIVSFGL